MHSHSCLWWWTFTASIMKMSTSDHRYSTSVVPNHVPVDHPTLHVLHLSFVWHTHCRSWSRYKWADYLNQVCLVKETRKMCSVGGASRNVVGNHSSTWTLISNVLPLSIKKPEPDMFRTDFVNIPQIGWSFDRIPLIKRVYLKMWLYSMPFRSHQLLSKLL